MCPGAQDRQAGQAYGQAYEQGDRHDESPGFQI